MMRWMLVVLVMLLLFNRLWPWLEKFGWGRLPGDIRFRLWGREFFLPVGSTIILSWVASVIVKWF